LAEHRNDDSGQCISTAADGEAGVSGLVFVNLMTIGDPRIPSLKDDDYAEFCGDLNGRCALLQWFIGGDTA